MTPPPRRGRGRVVLVIVDGLGDVSVPSFAGRTPLQVAHTPNMDAIAGESVLVHMARPEPGTNNGSPCLASVFLRRSRSPAAHAPRPPLSTTPKTKNPKPPAPTASWTLSSQASPAAATPPTWPCSAMTLGNTTADEAHSKRWAQG